MKTLRQITCDLAMSARGIPYIWAGSTPAAGFDCSGFIVWLFQTIGLLPIGDWNAQALAHHFASNTGLQKEPQHPGDLAFYGESPNAISHVMLCLDSDRVVGASGGGRKTNTRKIAEALGARVHTAHTNYRHDFTGIAPIKYPDET